MPSGLFNCGVNGVVTLDCIFPLLATLIYWALVFVGSLAVIFIIIAGLKYIMSWGDAKSVESARRTLTFAILGLLLVLFSFLVVNVIGKITNVACLNSNTPLSFTSCQ